MDFPDAAVVPDLDCLATPGHHPAAVTYCDRYTGISFTGDTVLPGPPER